MFVNDPLLYALIKESHDPVRAARYRPFSSLLEECQLRPLALPHPPRQKTRSAGLRRALGALPTRLSRLGLRPAAGLTACCQPGCC